MLAQRILDAASDFKERPAIITDVRTISYGELLENSRFFALQIIEVSRTCDGIRDVPVVGILLPHGEANVRAVLAAVFAGSAYIPIDPSYPEDRALFMLEHFGIQTVMVSYETLPLIQDLGKKLKTSLSLINMDLEPEDTCLLSPDGLPDPEDNQPCYIIMTSGSSGIPKGVVQGNHNVLGAMRHYSEKLGITQHDRFLYLSSFSHDGAVEDIFPPLLNGAVICPFDLKRRGIQSLGDWIASQEITIYHSVPTVFRYFTASLSGNIGFPSVRVISMGAETVKPSDLSIMARHFPNAIFSHMYGQTESSLNTMVTIDTSVPVDKIPLGDPIPGVQIFLLNEEGEEVEELERGEIFVVSPFLALGYYKNAEASNAAFLEDGELGRIYRTGDLARRELDGKLYFCGRKDQQIKIRGFRVEPGEIEHALLGLEIVVEAVVIPIEGSQGDLELCAYIVFRSLEESLNFDTGGLKDYLSGIFPDYMTPAYFVPLDSLPVTVNGKLDRQSLPKPDMARSLDYVPPQSNIQETLVDIWCDVLRIPAERIGIDDHFFRLGGHSLKATLLAARIYREFNVKVPLTEFFRFPTIRDQALLVAQGARHDGWDIEPVEKKEYFPLSSAQARLYFLEGLSERGTGFHMSAALRASGVLDVKRIQQVFSRLFKRHEILRSSFVLVNDEPVQRIWDHLDFRVQHCDLATPLDGDDLDPGWVRDELGNPFIKPFDLANPPLLRAGIVKVRENDFLLVFDMHHIIGDGTSMGILVGDFTRLYRGEALPPMELQYKDYAVWQRDSFDSGQKEQCESFWKNIYSDAPDIPRSDLPVDFSRDSMTEFSGAYVRVSLPVNVTEGLRALGEKYDVTLYMLLLAVLDVLMYKFTGLEDIIVGTAVSGRPHAGLDGMIGMFVNILPMRNFPRPTLRFNDFLETVKTRTLEALEYQDMPFDRLVRLLRQKKDSRLHPFYSISLTVQNYRASSLALDGIAITPINLKKNTSNIDINIFAFEMKNELQISIQYLTGLFKRKTIKHLAQNLMWIIETVCRDEGVMIRDIELLSDDSQQKAAADIEKDMDFFSRLEGEEFNEVF